MALLAPVKDELRLHAERVARLERIKELAHVEGKADLVARATRTLERETTRHESRMKLLAAGAPAAALSAAAPAPAPGGAK